VKVEILGETYSIRSEADPEHTRAVAQHRVVMLEPRELIAELALFLHTGLRPFLLELAPPGLGNEGAAPKAGELVAEVPHELLELTERKCFRTFAV
jgi:hypothetical protein